MTFTIDGEEFLFNMTLDGENHLIALTATKDSVTYDCTIQLISRADGDRMCCIPGGACQSGSC
jgi:hypothetical protein